MRTVMLWSYSHIKLFMTRSVAYPVVLQSLQNIIRISLYM